MSKIAVIRAGESLPFSFDRGGEDISDWICTIEVKNYPSDAAILTRLITPVNDAWPGFLTQTETTGLSNGLHFLTALLSNTTTDEESQVPLRFNVSTAWQ